jgi:molecular chaperone GrpE
MVDRRYDPEEQPDAAQQAMETENKHVETLKQELKLAQERASYLAADLENVRRRLDKERQHLVDAAQMTLLRDLLEIVDNFDRAFADLQHRPELAPYIAGFELIYKSLQKFLARYGVHEMTTLTVFNPEFHEAVIHVDEPNVEPGHIVTVLQKGYLYHNQVLRPARVSVKA